MIDLSKIKKIFENFIVFRLSAINLVPSIKKYLLFYFKNKSNY